MMNLKKMLVTVGAVVLLVSAVRADQIYVETENVVADSTNEDVLTFTETMPEFPGGINKMYQFLVHSLVYPKIAAKKGVQGRVTVRFVVTKTGEIRDVSVLRSLEPSLDAEAIRVVKSMPVWIPGVQDGKAVNVYYNLPIMFKLEK